jgi:predicted  nucleic acid-binding Zn-ribbon protein
LKEALARLIDLQKADTAALQTGKRRDEIDAKAREAEKLLAAAKSNEEAAHKTSQESKSHLHSLEMDLKEREGRIQVLNGKLGGATSNKEYQSILMEIGTIKAENGKVEEKILLAMDDVEAKEKGWEAAKAKTRETEGVVKASKAEVELRRAEFEAEIAAKKAERDAFAAQIPAEALRIYERIRAGNRTTGIAVVPVHGEYCQGCQMSITSQELSDLVGGTKIVLCRSCQRILVLEG